MTTAGPIPATKFNFPTKLLIVSLAAFAACLIIFLRFYRTAEVILSGRIIRLLSPYQTYVDTNRQIVYFGLGGPDPLGLKMTPECTSALLVLPLAVVAAVMIFLRPQIGRRVLISLGIATIALIIVNQLRMLLLCGLVSWFGTDHGYYWGHTLLGSIVSVFGGAIALVLFVWLSTKDGRKPRGTASDSGSMNR